MGSGALIRVKLKAGSMRKTKLKWRFEDVSRPATFRDSLTDVQEKAGDERYGWSLVGSMQAAEPRAPPVHRSQPKLPNYLATKETAYHFLGTWEKCRHRRRKIISSIILLLGHCPLLGTLVVSERVSVDIYQRKWVKELTKRSSRPSHRVSILCSNIQYYHQPSLVDLQG